MTQTAREQRKVEQIVAGARAAFVELGFEGTTVDEIARRAKVSKPTLYVHLGDKSAIFAEVLRREFEAQARGIFPEAPAQAPVEETLRAIAEHYIGFLISKPAQDIFRVAVAESQRFPDIGRAFYDSGPGLGAARLATYLRACVARGELVIDDLNLAAHQFIELCRADLFYRRLLRAEAIKPAAIRKVAASSVRLFLAGYARPTPRSL